MGPLNIVFMGSDDLSCPCLAALLAEPNYKVAAVVTQPDRPKGRHLKPTPSPVKTAALAANIPVLQPERARDDGFTRQLGQISPDMIVVVAYGQILPRSILELPKFGCLNVHTSLLPKYRGAAPIQWAILNGEPETGVTIMRIDAGLDTGDILMQEATPIAPADNSETLHARLGQMGASLLLRTIPTYVNGEITPRPQPAEGVSYAAKIKKQDGEIDWSQPATTTWNKVRALTPWPGAYTWFEEKSTRLRLKVLHCEPDLLSGKPGEVVVSHKNSIVVACGQGSLNIKELQLEGGRRLTPQQFLAGHTFSTGYGFPGVSVRPSSQ